jgi:cyclopropane fatty-acyl-phospholipid synthase-like methyltransferase
VPDRKISIHEERTSNVTGQTNPWEQIYLERGRVFAGVHEDIERIIRLLNDRRAEHVLDLGCGAGRHLVQFARSGFSVHGLDASPEATRLAREWLASEGLQAVVRLQDIYEPLPYADAFFDAVVSVQVIHHARIAAIRQLVGELTRVLKPGGFVFVTVPATQNQASTFNEIEPGTLVPLDGPEQGLPHHYFTAGELRNLFEQFDLEDAHVDSHQHFCLSGFKHQPPREPIVP